MNYFKITETEKKTSEIIEEMRTKFDVYCYLNESQLDKDFPAPKEVTTRYFKKTVEADEELRNKLADDLEKEGIQGITLRERLIMELQYFEETGKHLDIDNFTLCAVSRYSDGRVPLVGWDTDDRGVCVGWDNSDNRGGYLRSRVAFLDPSLLSSFNPSESLKCPHCKHQLKITIE